MRQVSSTCIALYSQLVLLSHTFRLVQNDASSYHLECHRNLSDCLQSWVDNEDHKEANVYDLGRNYRANTSVCE